MRSERAQSGGERPSRVEQVQQVRQGQPNNFMPRRLEVQGSTDGPQRFERGNRMRGERFQQVQEVQQVSQDQSVQPQGWRDRRDRRSSGDAAQGGFVQPDRELPRVMRTRDRTPVVSEVPRQGTQPPLRVEGRRWAQTHWDHNWRNDRRYDWRNWRNRHRSLFRIGFYYDPFGWGYQPYS